MEIKNSRILILGGSGLVGRTIARFLLSENPSTIIIHSKTEGETKTFLKEFRLELVAATASKRVTRPEGVPSHARNDSEDVGRDEGVAGPAEFYKIKLIGEWGDLFDADFLSPLSPKILKNSYLYKLILKHHPDIIIDAVNTATAIAYQNLFEKALLVREASTAKNVRNLLSVLYIPKLVRHIQVLYEAMRPKGGQESVKLYLKIGTTGTGGMGFNIPFTHGEEKPSRMLLSKSALAGAQSQLLYLLSQTPDAPRIVELKPATSIAWGKLGNGPIKDISVKDCAKPTKLKFGGIFKTGKGVVVGEKLTSTFVDSGENGLFSPEEFRALSDPSQMGFITPGEIAGLAVREIKGESTGKNVMESLEKYVLGPSKTAAAKRGEAFTTLKTLGDKESESPALGFLGPPRLSKLLFEGRIIKETFGSFKKYLEASASEGDSLPCKVSPLRAKGGADSRSQRSQSQIALKTEKEILSNTSLRRFALTAGIPILLPNGKELICVQYHKVPESGEDQKITLENIDSWARRGWIDLRIDNFKLWRERLRSFSVIKGREPNFEGEVAAFIFETEDGGYRKTKSH